MHAVPYAPPPRFRPAPRPPRRSGAAPSSEEVRHLAEEVMAHLQGLAGADVLLAAYNAARADVRATRLERRRRAAQQSLLDPEAAAKRRIRKQQRKAVGRRKQVEEVRRQRAAGVAVKNKRSQRDGGRGKGSGGKRQRRD